MTFPNPDSALIIELTERVRVLTEARDLLAEECDRHALREAALTEAARAVIDDFDNSDDFDLAGSLVALRGVLDKPDEKVWTVDGVEVLDYHGPRPEG